MISIEITGVKKWMLRTLVIACGVGIAIVLLEKSGLSLRIQGYLVQPKQEATTWRFLETKDVENGAIITANTHTIFHLPATFTRINRETLLGQKGDDTRYWGYCFPENEEPDTLANRTGFPGLIFLSEKERIIRAQDAARQTARYSPRSLPTSQEVTALNNPTKSAIRHQLEVFLPHTMCYIMSEAPLSIGLDADNDRLNGELEREIKTNPQSPDSDGDGIGDGIEYLNGINPLLRDTDGDGIIDGIEDADWNGRISLGETDPRVMDTDRDGLCDGMCRVRLKKNDVFMGEDKNLNGVVDEGESDPRRYSTSDNGISDQIPYLQCIAAGGDVCP